MLTVLVNISLILITSLIIVRTSFDSNPKQEWTQAQKARTINLQIVGEKASLSLGKRYWQIVLKGKSYTCTNTKSILSHALIVSSIVQNSFFLLLYFFNISLFFVFPLLFFPLNLFLCYILWFFPCPISPLLEPFTLSCKAACLLFRHHLHINAARELAGQHLMRRQQYFQIFVIPYPYPLSGICPSPCRKILLICCIKRLRRFLTTSDRGSEMVIILEHG